MSPLREFFRFLWYSLVSELFTGAQLAVARSCVSLYDRSIITNEIPAFAEKSDIPEVSLAKGWNFVGDDGSVVQTN